jgi:hypothetical protein
LAAKPILVLPSNRLATILFSSALSSGECGANTAARARAVDPVTPFGAAKATDCPKVASNTSATKVLVTEFVTMLAPHAAIKTAATKS